MIPYILVFFAIISCHFLSCLRFFQNKKKLKIIISVWAPIALLIVFSTIKSNAIGNDTIGYYNEYQVAKVESMSYLNNHLSNFEFGFRYLFIAFAKIGLPFKVFQLFVYSVIYILIGIILQKESKYPSLAIIIFCLWSWMMFNFSALRQGLSDTIAFFSLFLASRIFNKKYKNIIVIIVSLALLGLSCTFHRSSVFFAMAFVLLGLKRIVPEYFGKITLFITLLIPFIFILAPEFYQYIFYLLKTNKYIPTQRTDAIELFILYFAILIVALIFNSNNKLASKTNDLFSKTFSKVPLLKDEKDAQSNAESKTTDFTELAISIFSIGVIIQSFSTVCNVMLRAANPFLLFAIIFIPNVIYKNNSKSLRIFAQVAVIVLFLLVFYIDYYKTNYLHGFPYTI